jgi:hypothetical protein
MKTSIFKLVLITPVFILLSHYLVVFPHEYAHSFMAWILGYKNNPFLLNYGGTSWNNLLLLAYIDENVDYLTIYNAGHGYYVALIAFAGPGIANGLLFLVSLYLLNRPRVKQEPYIFYFLFWFNLMTLGNFYDYVPIRTFAQHGDVYAFVKGLNISPWLVYFVIGYLVTYLIWNFFTKTLISAYKNLEINSIAPRAALMIICVCILFGFFGGIIGVLISSVFVDYTDISHFLSLTSFLMIPGMIIACWPTRLWVQQQLSLYNAISIHDLSHQ